MGMDMPPIGERNIKTEPFSIKDVLLTLIEAVPGIEVIIVDDRQEIIKGFFLQLARCAIVSLKAGICLLPESLHMFGTADIHQGKPAIGKRCILSHSRSAQQQRQDYYTDKPFHLAASIIHTALLPYPAVFPE
jgi:hypothetical protein